MLLARGLARRKRRAWRIAVVLLLGSAVLHIFHGMGSGATATGLLAIALVARRQDFSAEGDPSSQPRVLLRAALLLLGIYAYGAAALWMNRLVADRPFTLPFSLSETSRALVGLSLVHGHRHLSGDFADWFPASVVILELAAVVIVLAAWLAPWRYRLGQEARERELARALVSTYGEDTLAPFALRADKSYFFSESERAFLAYRVVGGVAIVSGDPIGPDDELASLLARFVEFVHARDWRIAILGASDRCLALYRAHGLQALYHGDEAVVDDGAVLARRPRDPEGSPVGAPAREGRLRGARGDAARALRRAAGRARGGRACLARIGAGARLRDGPRRALPARRRRRGLRDRAEPGRRGRGIPPLRGLARRQGALALDDAAVALGAERVHRVARLRRRRVGAGQRLREGVAELRPVRGAARARCAAVRAATAAAARAARAEGPLPARQPARCSTGSSSRTGSRASSSTSTGATCRVSGSRRSPRRATCRSRGRARRRCEREPGGRAAARARVDGRDQLGLSRAALRRVEAAAALRPPPDPLAPRALHRSALAVRLRRGHRRLGALRRRAEARAALARPGRVGRRDRSARAARLRGRRMRASRDASSGASSRR